MNSHAEIGVPDTVALTGFSTALLRKELFSRQEENARPECGSGRQGPYNTPLHVFALFLILVLSTLACSFPIIARRFPRLPVPHRFLFLSRHFGTGVLIATAFVHLLPTAFVSLTDPCLPPFWNEGYPAMAGLIAMISVLIVVGIEMFFATRGAGHVHGGEYDSVENTTSTFTPKSRNSKAGNGSIRHFRTESVGQDQPVDSASLEWRSSQDAIRREEAGFFDRDDNEDMDLDAEDDDHDPAAAYHDGQKRLNDDESDTEVFLEHPAQNDGKALDQKQEEQRLLLQCLLLEAGILFHSIFIGMAVSVATGAPFIVLLIAISFHQTFEGLALGSRISAITAFGPGSPKPWLMALAYGTTTPIGQAIGLLMHNLYDPFSETGLLTVGVMNAISSGLLLFAGLVELLAEDFLSDKSYTTLHGRKRLEACGAVVAGSMLMALVGAWA